jgi:tRNA-Thr(GGU) m(6)t(6)A37 methyltransferase TsaA
MITIEPIGYVSTTAEAIPRTWQISDVEGALIIDDKYREGLEQIESGQQIFVIFHFHKSVPFEAKYLRFKRPHDDDTEMRLFSTHSPIRPNPIGLSILKVTGRDGSIIRVKGLDMLDGTPILDIKPYQCPD